MGKFQIFVLLSVVTCAIISTVQSVPVSDTSVASENAAKCKKLCGFCGCTGYYCGDECLCECNSPTEGEAECVDTMKSNCKKLELPFEVLIQGPNVNRMVRSLLYADPEEEACVQSSKSNEKKRSTISIYKPDGSEQRDEILSAPVAHKVDEERTQEDDSPIHVIVAEKLPVKMEQLEEDVKENIERNVENVESNDESDSLKLPLPDDNVDRTNIKRHIIDINQDMSDYHRDSDDDSFIYKRDADEEKKEEKTDGDESVGAPAPVPVAPAAAAAAVVPAILMPRFHDAIEHMKAQIPTSVEIRGAWEGVRNELNTKINSAIAEAKLKAADLRNKIAPTPPPVPVTPAPPLLVIPAKPATFNAFLRSENDGNDVGMPLLPAVPLIPVVPALQIEIAKNIAASRAAAFPIQTKIAKDIANFRLNNKLIQENAKKAWLVPSGVRRFS